jgi:hypothetical protein
VFRLVTHGTELGLHLLLDRQVHLALGVVELALLSDQVGLGLLGFGQLGVALPQHLVEVGDLFDLGVNVDGNEARPWRPPECRWHPWPRRAGPAGREWLLPDRRPRLPFGRVGLRTACG